MRRCLVFAFVAASVTSPTRSVAQNDPALASRIATIIERPEFRHALWGIEIYDADANRPVYALNEDKLFTPGSTTKLLSAGTALAKLGATHRFSTTIYRTGPISSSGTLTGDLVLVASGDPNLSQRLQPDGSLAFENHDHSYGGAPDSKAVPGDPLVVIRQLATQVAATGIRRVTGRVLIDVSLYAEGTRELGTGVVVSPIMVNDNVLDIVAAPGVKVGDPLQLTVTPATRYVRIVNRTRTVPVDSAASIDQSDSVGTDGNVTLTVTGGMPLGKAGILYAYPVPSPSRFAQTVLADALIAAGVSVAPARGGALPDFAKLAMSYTAANLVAEHRSAPATEMVKVVLKVSQNMHASGLPMLMGALYGKQGQNGFDVEREWLQSVGLDTKGAQQADGAGGDAHFTPAFMVGRNLIVVVYVNNVFVSLAADEITRVVGQALGEVAATTWSIR